MTSTMSLDDILNNIKATKRRFPNQVCKKKKNNNKRPPPPAEHAPGVDLLLEELLVVSREKRRRPKRRFEHVSSWQPLVKRRRYARDVQYYE